MTLVNELTAPLQKSVNVGAQDFAPRPYRFSVREYEMMIDAGVFQEDDRVELLNGVLVEMSPKKASHSSGVHRADDALSEAVGDLAIVRTQDVVVLNDDSEPEPDLALLRPPLERYDNEHPTAADMFLLLEVSDTTLRYDRNTKGPAYAASNIPQYLILNVKDREVEDYREPGADGYRARRTYVAGQSFNLVAFPDVTIKVSNLLPSLPDHEI